MVKVPNNARAHSNLGIAFTDQGRYAVAIEQGQQALQFDDTGAYAQATETPASPADQARPFKSL